MDRVVQAGPRLGPAGSHQLFYPVLRVQRYDRRTAPYLGVWEVRIAGFVFHRRPFFRPSPGTVRIEMFRNMQNAEIIRKMTEEFDEVKKIKSVLH